MGIILRNVGIFEEKIGGDKWGFLIAEVGISTLNFLATLICSGFEKFCNKHVTTEVKFKKVAYS